MIAQVQLKQRMTVAEFDEFALLPENSDRLWELVCGWIYEVASNPYSSSIVARIKTAIETYLLKNDLGHLTGADVGYKIGDDRHVFDLAFTTHTRQPQLPFQKYHDGFNPAIPDLVVEVLPPDYDTGKVRQKVFTANQLGCVVWVVEPDNQTVEVYALKKLVKFARMNDTLDGGEILPGFTLAVKDVFPSEETE